MIPFELDALRITLSQVALGKDGQVDEPQWLTLRAVDGIGGRFYQIVTTVYGEEKYWSFTEVDDLILPLRKFVEMANKIGDE